jgi:hypothetical protein
MCGVFSRSLGEPNVAVPSQSRVTFTVIDKTKQVHISLFLGLCRSHVAPKADHPLFRSLHAGIECMFHFNVLGGPDDESMNIQDEEAIHTRR